MPEINSLIDKVKQEAARLTADVQEEDSAKIAPEAETQPQEGVEETTPEIIPMVSAFQFWRRRASFS